jgi:hypothetical protein
VYVDRSTVLNNTDLASRLVSYIPTCKINQSRPKSLTNVVVILLEIADVSAQFSRSGL